jgi:hypothetical protein
MNGSERPPVLLTPKRARIGLLEVGVSLTHLDILTQSIIDLADAMERGEAAHNIQSMARCLVMPPNKHAWYTQIVRNESNQALKMTVNRMLGIVSALADGLPWDAGLPKQLRNLVASIRTLALPPEPRETVTDQKLFALALLGKYQKEYRNESREGHVKRICDAMGKGRSTVFGYLRTERREPKKASVDEALNRGLSPRRKRGT